MKLYRERTTKDFLWALVLQSINQSSLFSEQ